jgi:hypothetical protein
MQQQPRVQAYLERFNDIEIKKNGSFWPSVSYSLWHCGGSGNARSLPKEMQEIGR